MSAHRLCRGGLGEALRTSPQHRRRGDVLKRQAAASRDLLRTLELLQRRHSGVHDVDRVVRAERLGEHVVDARALQHRAHRTTRDHTGTGRRRTQQHDAGRVLALHRVRDRALNARHAEEVLLGLLDALGDSRGHLLGLAVADADPAVAVADHAQGGEAEAPAALADLRHSVDLDYALDVRDALVCGTTAAIFATVPPLTTAGTAPRSCSHQWFLFSFSLRVGIISELQPTLTGTVGPGGDTTGVPVAATVEDDLLD